MTNRFKDRFKRENRQTVNEVERILIVSEGTETEPNYFNGFQTYIRPTIKTVGAGENTIDVVKRAITERDRTRKNPKKRYDQVWCVFDRDQFPPERFRAAIKLATEENIKLAYSIESFELWVLLHFTYLTTEIGRAAYITKINAYLKKEGFGKYSKNNPNLYQQLLPHQNTALANAAKLELKYQSKNDVLQHDPVTLVHHLVLTLNAQGKARLG